MRGCKGEGQGMGVAGEGREWAGIARSALSQTQGQGDMNNWYLHGEMTKLQKA